MTMVKQKLIIPSLFILSLLELSPAAVGSESSIPPNCLASAANALGSPPAALSCCNKRAFSSRNSRISLSVGLSLTTAFVLMALARSATN